MCNTWEELEKLAENCISCKLHKVRKNVLFGEGSKNAKIMIIGDNISGEEEKQKKFFFGKAGRLLEFAFQTVGIKKEEIYMTNIVKCRTPANRVPEQDECYVCLNYLRNQVMLLKPNIIILLGDIVINNILGNEFGTVNQGKIVEKKGIKYLCTYSAKDFIQDENLKLKFIKDLELVRKEY